MISLTRTLAFVALILALLTPITLAYDLKYFIFTPQCYSSLVESMNVGDTQCIKLVLMFSCLDSQQTSRLRARFGRSYHQDPSVNQNPARQVRLWYLVHQRAYLIDDQLGHNCVQLAQGKPLQHLWRKCVHLGSESVDNGLVRALRS